MAVVTAAAPNETSGAGGPNETPAEAGTAPNEVDGVAPNVADGAGVVPKEGGATDPKGVEATPNALPNDGAGVDPELNGFVTRAGVDDPLPNPGGAGVDPA
jgi:hypothetical protein